MSSNTSKIQLRSTITRERAVQWGKTLRIEKLYFNESLVENFVEALKANRAGITEEEIEKEKKNMIMRDNFFNMVMDEVSSAYKVTYDEAELAEKEAEFKKVHVNFTEEQIKNHARISIFKQLIYDDLARDWEIEVTDEMAKQVLENYYKTTGKSIREYLEDPEKLSTVKKDVLEQIITNRIMNAFEAQFELQQDNVNSAKS